RQSPPRHAPQCVAGSELGPRRDPERQLLRVVWVELELAQRVADRIPIGDARQLGVEGPLDAGGPDLPRRIADHATERVRAVDAVRLARVGVALVRGEDLPVAV